MTGLVSKKNSRAIECNTKKKEAEKRKRRSKRVSLLQFGVSPNYYGHRLILHCMDPRGTSQFGDQVIFQHMGKSLRQAQRASGILPNLTSIKGLLLHSATLHSFGSLPNHFDGLKSSIEYDRIGSKEKCMMTR